MKASIVSPLNYVRHLDYILESGANEVYFGLQGSLNSRNFSQLNIDSKVLGKVVKKCHEKGAKANMVMNSFPGSVKVLNANKSIIKKASLEGVDSIIAASFSVMNLINEIDSEMPIHVSVMSAISDPESINFLAEKFNIERTIQGPDKSIDETKRFVKKLNKGISLEVIAFGTLSYGFQGNCNLSKFMSGIETNTAGVCSHPKFLHTKNKSKSMELYFKDVLIGESEKVFKGDMECLKKCEGGCLLAKEKGHGWKNTALVNKRYVCRGLYMLGNRQVRFQDYEYLNILSSCRELISVGVDAFKIEGRQRPIKYSAMVTKLFSDMINNGKYSKREYKEVEKEFFPGMKPFQGGLDNA